MKNFFLFKTKKKLFFSIFILRSSRHANREIWKFQPDLTILNFHLFHTPVITQNDDEREQIRIYLAERMVNPMTIMLKNSILLATKMAEIWSSDG